MKKYVLVLCCMTITPSITCAEKKEEKKTSWADLDETQATLEPFNRDKLPATWRKAAPATPAPTKTDSSTSWRSKLFPSTQKKLTQPAPKQEQKAPAKKLTHYPPISTESAKPQEPATPLPAKQEAKATAYITPAQPTIGALYELICILGHEVHSLRTDIRALHISSLVLDEDGKKTLSSHRTAMKSLGKNIGRLREQLPSSTLNPSAPTFIPSDSSSSPKS
jgi:hypothetical protein